MGFILALYFLCSTGLTGAVCYSHMRRPIGVYKLVHDLGMAWAWPVALAVRKPWR